MVLCPLNDVLCGVDIRALNLVGESLKVCIDDVEVLDPGLVKFFIQLHVDPRYLLWLLAKAMYSDALVPTEYIDGQVILLLHFWDMRDGRGGIDPLKVQTIFGGVPSWSLWVMLWQWICQSRSERPSKTVVIPVFHVDYCLLRPYSCWEWDVRVASQWLISSDVQPESLYSVEHPPQPSLCPLFKQLQEVGMALFRSSLISFASCLWRSTGSVYSSLPPKLDIESKLELDSTDSQYLSLQLIMDSGFHVLH